MAQALGRGVEVDQIELGIGDGIVVGADEEDGEGVEEALLDIDVRQGLLQDVVAAGHEAEEEVLLGAEVAVEGAYGDPGIPGEGVDARAVKALLREMPESHGEDGLPPLDIYLIEGRGVKMPRGAALSFPCFHAGNSSARGRPDQGDGLSR